MGEPGKRFNRSKDQARRCRSMAVMPNCPIGLAATACSSGATCLLTKQIIPVVRDGLCLTPYQKRGNRRPEAIKRSRAEYTDKVPQRAKDYGVGRHSWRPHPLPQRSRSGNASTDRTFQAMPRCPRPIRRSGHGAHGGQRRSRTQGSVASTEAAIPLEYVPLRHRVHDVVGRNFQARAK
jgi:hypothetical protein